MKASIYHKIITVCTFLIIPQAVSLNFCLSAELTEYVPNESEYKIGSKRFFYDANRIDLNTAIVLSNFIFANYGKEDVPVLVRIPHSDDFYLVSAHGKATKEDYGRRFFLLKKGRAKIDVLFVGKGVMDSYILRPVFYYRDDRVLVLAELGTEYSWGLDAYEFHRGKMKSLGLIDVALDPEEPFSDLVSPLRNAKAEYKNDTYYVTFFGKLYLHPGSDDQELIESKTNSVVFYFNGKKFVQAK